MSLPDTQLDSLPVPTGEKERKKKLTKFGHSLARLTLIRVKFSEVPIASSCFILLLLLKVVWTMYNAWIKGSEMAKKNWIAAAQTIKFFGTENLHLQAIVLLLRWKIYNKKKEERTG